MSFSSFRFSASYLSAIQLKLAPLASSCSNASQFTREFSLVLPMLNFAAAAAASAGSTAFKILHPPFDCQLFTYSCYFSPVRRRRREAARNTYSNEHSSRKRCRNITLKRMRFTQLFTYSLLTIYRHNELAILLFCWPTSRVAKVGYNSYSYFQFHFEAKLFIFSCNSRTYNVACSAFPDKTILGFVSVSTETSFVLQRERKKEIKRSVSQ